MAADKSTAVPSQNSIATLPLYQQSDLLAAMQKRDFYTVAHKVANIRTIETHISTVFLTGVYAYKVKKPVNFGFLDFSQLNARAHFCAEELRLNRRLASALYLDVVPLSRRKEGGFILGQEPQAEIVEYAVKMRQFKQTHLLDLYLAEGRLLIEHMDMLGQQIAQFHADIAVAKSDCDFGLPPKVLTPMLHNFKPIAEVLQHKGHQARLKRLQNWTQQTYQTLIPYLEQRRKAGFIRECHGDMHLGNMAIIKNSIIIFDGIEFNEDLRWIDVASEIAFLVMDLEDRQAFAHAHRVLNVYLEASGDYELCRVLNFYKVYRAMVRAKVTALRLATLKQEKPAEADEALNTCLEYLELAEHYTSTRPNALFITHGLSGSGKSYGSVKIADTLGMVIIRSDVERKRMTGLTVKTPQATDFAQGIYNPKISDKVYDLLLSKAAMLLDAGISVIVDATFLQKQHRQDFAQLAASKNKPFSILHFHAETAQLRENIQQRQELNDDPSDANIDVMETQQAHYTPLTAQEPSIILNYAGAIPYEEIQTIYTRSTGKSD